MMKTERRKKSDAPKPNPQCLSRRTWNEFKDEEIRKQTLVGGARPRRRYEAGNVALSKRQTEKAAGKGR